MRSNHVPPQTLICPLGLIINNAATSHSKSVNEWWNLWLCTRAVGTKHMLYRTAVGWLQLVYCGNQLCKIADKFGCNLCSRTLSQAEDLQLVFVSERDKVVIDLLQFQFGKQVGQSVVKQVVSLLLRENTHICCSQFWTTKMEDAHSCTNLIVYDPVGLCW